MLLPSVLWRCWLGSRKGIRPVKNWVVGCWHGNLYGARCRLTYGPACVTFFSEIQIGLPFWYRLTRVVPEKRAVNGCVCVVTTIKFPQPLWWLATTDPTPSLRCFTVFSAAFLGTVSRKAVRRFSDFWQHVNWLASQFHNGDKWDQSSV